MNTRIEVFPHEPASKCLTREVYEFRALPGISRIDIYLDCYFVQERKTTRHGWHSLKIYSRLNRRNSNIPAPSLTDDMKNRAERALIESIRSSMRWAE